MINHPIPASPDLDSTSGSFSPDTVQQLIQGAMEDEGEDTENEDNDDDKRSTLKQVRPRIASKRLIQPQTCGIKIDNT